jgi:hypothetical protein
MAVDAITGALQVADDVGKLALQKDAQLNTPAEVVAKEAAQVQALKDAIKAALEKGDLNAIQLLCA